MASRPRWAIASLLTCAVASWASSEGVGAKDRRPVSGVPLHTINEFETTARLLAVLLDSGRNVINEHQVLFDEQETTEKDFTADLFERQLLDVFHSRSGTDLRDLEASRIPAGAKKLLKKLVVVSKQVVAEAHVEINRPDGGRTEFIPAIFGSRVAVRFTEQTHVRLKQTALAPRNPLNAPDPAERTALESFADPFYPLEKAISEVTAQSRSLRRRRALIRRSSSSVLPYVFA